MRALLLLLLGLLPLTLHGSIKKGSAIESKKEITKLYKEDGSFNLATIFDSAVGTKLQFKLPDDNSLWEGEVTSITSKPNETYAVVGKLKGDGNPGFIFVASTNKSVGGALFFPEKSISYVLKYDEKKEVFFLEKKKFEVRKE